MASIYNDYGIRLAMDGKGNVSGIGTFGFNLFDGRGSFTVYFDSLEVLIPASSEGNSDIVIFKMGDCDLAAPVATLSDSVFFTADDAEGYQWYLNGKPVAGATSHTFTPLVSGMYAVRINKAGCQAFSEEHQFKKATGI
ncbi:MAG: hypothetical protein M3Q97_08965 [Bacteroidota bacterium]|nr:hypothetical protein [Bacteroidota bacterium]